MLAHGKALMSAWLVPASVSLGWHGLVISLFTLVTVSRSDESPSPPALSTLADQEFEVDDVASDIEPGKIEPPRLEIPEPLVGEEIGEKLKALGLPAGVRQSGPADNGLVLCLTASADTIRPGESITFTTWICNLTDQDLTVEVGYSTCGVYLATGTALCGLVEGGGKMEQFYFNGACGTGARYLYQTIPARSAVRHDSDWTFGRQPGWRGGRPVMGYHRGPFLNLAAPASGMHRFHVGLKSAASLERYLGDKVCSKVVVPNFWVGEVRSNDVRIQVNP